MSTELGLSSSRHSVQCLRDAEVLSTAKTRCRFQMEATDPVDDFVDFYEFLRRARTCRTSSSSGNNA